MDEADGTARAYEYDDLYRLTKETVTGGQSYENSFTYDAVSNRKTQTTTRGGDGSVDAAAGEVDAGMSGARTINYGYDNRDRLTSEDQTVYSWSENGNLVGKTGEATYEWDFEDRLLRVVKDGVVVENVYDVDGVLVRTLTNGVATDLLVDTSDALSHVVAEIDGSGTVTAVYVRADDMLLEEIRGGVAKMYEADGLGSTRSLLDTTGTQTDTWSYEAFGTTLSSTGSAASPYRFAGERFVEAAGMYQNRARWLDTRVGRFASVDPECAGAVCDDPSRAYPYLYGGADPVDMVDPEGRFYISSLGATLTMLWNAAAPPSASPVQQGKAAVCPTCEPSCGSVATDVGAAAIAAKNAASRLAGVSVKYAKSTALLQRQPSTFKFAKLSYAKVGAVKLACSTTQTLGPTGGDAHWDPANTKITLYARVLKKTYPESQATREEYMRLLSAALLHEYTHAAWTFAKTLKSPVPVVAADGRGGYVNIAKWGLQELAAQYAAYSCFKTDLYSVK